MQDVKTYSSKAEAEMLAQLLTRTDDDGWSYVVRPAGKRFRIVGVDPEGYELGTL
jgi:hypothetical protein